MGEINGIGMPRPVGPWTWLDLWHSLGRLILRDAVLSWPCVLCMACLLLHLYLGICKMPTLVDFDTLIPGLARELFSVGASHTGITHLSCKRNKMTSEAAQRLNPTTALVPTPAYRKPLPARWPGDCVPVFLHLTICLCEGNGFDGGQLPRQLPQLPPARTQQHMQCPWLGSGVGLVVSLFAEKYASA